MSHLDIKEKYCPSCKITKKSLEFSKCTSKSDQLQSICKICDMTSSYNRRIKTRRTVLDYYGGFCGCCGENRIEFLAIHHLKGNGTKHRKSINNSRIYEFLKHNNYPKDFSVLCHNCNNALGHHNYCPHSVDNIFLELFRNKKEKSSWNSKARREALEHYGYQCECCLIKEREFLTFDHISGFQNIGPRGGDPLVLWLRKNNYPKDFVRILCFNCNTSFGHYGYCPHVISYQGILISNRFPEEYQCLI